MEGVRTTIKDSVDDFIRVVRKTARKKSAEAEGLNPRIFCGESIPQEMPKKDVDFTSAF